MDNIRCKETHCILMQQLKETNRRLGELNKVETEFKQQEQQLQESKEFISQLKKKLFTVLQDANEKSDEADILLQQNTHLRKSLEEANKKLERCNCNVLKEKLDEVNISNIHLTEQKLSLESRNKHLNEEMFLLKETIETLKKSEKVKESQLNSLIQQVKEINVR
jgi:chromosome segregation ATPase